MTTLATFEFEFGRLKSEDFEPVARACAVEIVAPEISVIAAMCSKTSTSVMPHSATRMANGDVTIIIMNCNDGVYRIQACMCEYMFLQG